MWGVRLVAAATVVVVQLLLAAPAAGAATPAIDASRLDHFVTEQLRDQNIPGAALSVTSGTSTYTRGYGVTSTDAKVGAHTPFRVASLSKSFTAVCVLQLVKAGRLALDAPVVQYLSTFRTADPRSDQITVRQLLNQTSGVADAGFTLPGDDVRTLAQRVAGLTGGRLAERPGTEFHYSDLNYAILARLVEVASETPFDTYLAEHVLTPLHMSETTSTITAQDAVTAAPQLRDGFVQLFGVPVARPELRGFLGGSGGVVSTAADLTHWLQFQLGHGESILTTAELTLTHQPPRNLPTDYAMGWTERRDGATYLLEHTGILSTYFAYQALIPATSGADAPVVGFAMLFNIYHGLIDFSSITEGVRAILQGRTPTGSGTDVRLASTVLVLAAATVVVMAVGARAALRPPRWARRRLGLVRSGLSWAVYLAPAVVLVALPLIILVLTGRRFTYPQLVLALPEVLVLLGAATIAGLATGIRRLIPRRRLDHEPRSTGLPSEPDPKQGSLAR